MYAASKVDWFPDAPLIGDSSIKTDFVEGSQRGWAVSAALVKEQPDIYKALETAISKASQDPEAVAALQKQQLSTTWFGPDESNKSFRANAEKMAKYIDLLK